MTIQIIIFDYRKLFKMNEYIDERFSFKLENGIIFCEWLKEHIDYKYVDEGIKIRLDITKDSDVLMLSDITKVKSGTREARQRMSEKDAGKGVKAVAVLVNSKVQKILYNFFNNIYKAPAPTKLFTNKAEAIKWLEKFK